MKGGVVAKEPKKDEAASRVTDDIGVGGMRTKAPGRRVDGNIGPSGGKVEAGEWCRGRRRELRGGGMGRHRGGGDIKDEGRVAESERRHGKKREWLEAAIGCNGRGHGDEGRGGRR